MTMLLRTGLCVSVSCQRGWQLCGQCGHCPRTSSGSKHQRKNLLQVGRIQKTKSRGGKLRRCAWLWLLILAMAAMRCNEHQKTIEYCNSWIAWNFPTLGVLFEESCGMALLRLVGPDWSGINEYMASSSFATDDVVLCWWINRPRMATLYTDLALLMAS